MLPPLKLYDVPDKGQQLFFKQYWEADEKNAKKNEKRRRDNSDLMMFSEDPSRKKMAQYKSINNRDVDQYNHLNLSVRSS